MALPISSIIELKEQKSSHHKKVLDSVTPPRREPDCNQRLKSSYEEGKN